MPLGRLEKASVAQHVAHLPEEGGNVHLVQPGVHHVQALRLECGQGFGELSLRVRIHSVGPSVTTQCLRQEVVVPNLNVVVGIIPFRVDGPLRCVSRVVQNDEHEVEIVTEQRAELHSGHLEGSIALKADDTTLRCREGHADGNGEDISQRGPVGGSRCGVALLHAHSGQVDVATRVPCDNVALLHKVGQLRVHEVHGERAVLGAGARCRVGESKRILCNQRGTRSHLLGQERQELSQVDTVHDFTLQIDGIVAELDDAVLATDKGAVNKDILDT